MKAGCRIQFWAIMAPQPLPVTDRGWLNEIPVEHPTLMVTEGLLPYLTDTQNRQLLSWIIDRFSSGELD